MTTSERNLAALQRGFFGYMKILGSRIAKSRQRPEGRGLKKWARPGQSDEVKEVHVELMARPHEENLYGNPEHHARKVVAKHTI